MMKIAFSTIGCPGWSFNEIFATAKDLGFGGIEIRGIREEMDAPSVKEFAPENLPATMAKISRSHVRICMVTSGAQLGLPEVDANVAQARRYIDFAARIGAPYVRLLITDKPEAVPGESVEQTIRLYRELCAYAQDKNVSPLLETNASLADTSVMRRVMQEVDMPNMGVLWDLHHPYRYFGETPEQTYANIGPYIRHLHVKDSVMADGKVQYRMMGYGDVPVFDTLKLLHDNGFDGYISLEWIKRWQPDLQEPGIVFSHFASYMKYLLDQIED